MPQCHCFITIIIIIIIIITFHHYYYHHWYHHYHYYFNHYTHTLSHTPGLQDEASGRAGGESDRRLHHIGTNTLVQEATHTFRRLPTLRVTPDHMGIFGDSSWHSVEIVKNPELYFPESLLLLLLLLLLFHCYYCCSPSSFFASQQGDCEKF